MQSHIGVIILESTLSFIYTVFFQLHYSESDSHAHIWSIHIHTIVSESYANIYMHMYTSYLPASDFPSLSLSHTHMHT